MTDMRRYICYRVLAGSRAFGLETPDSDRDLRGVYLPPAEATWSLDKPPEQIEFQSPGVEEVYWELEKFLKMALKANPNILECLWSPSVLDADETGRGLRALRGAFLSRLVYQTYSGYVASQFALLRRHLAETGQFKRKHAMHLIRLLHSGIQALKTGEILVDVGAHRDELLRIRLGETPFEEIEERRKELDARFQEAFATTTLPERPDRERVNCFLIEARRRMI